MNLMPFILLVFCTMMGALAGLFFKRASAADGILQLITNLNLWIGGFIYLATALLNIYILRFLQYSVVLPFTAITYIWTMIISYVVLKERITAKKMIGVACIVIGAVFIAGA